MARLRTVGAVAGAALIAHAAAAQLAQQGGKLVGSGAVGTANQGDKVAISADGGTVIVAGPNDNAITGAAWVFARTAGAWTQQGSKLVGTGAIGPARQGSSVALAADGNTAVLGGEYDNAHAGAAWVFTRSGGAWSQQGGKLVGTGMVGAAFQGVSAAISADGNTVIVGGPEDDLQTGAAWVFTRTNGAWSQQGDKLLASDSVGGSAQGWSVALSADGNTAVVGGPGDNGNAGAAWVYTRSGGAWSQLGSKLVGAGAAGNGQQGVGVAISADGGTIVVGGNADDSSLGAAWVYAISGGVWEQQGGKLTGADAVGAARQGVSVAVAADGSRALVGGWQDGAGVGAAWLYGRGAGTWSQLGSKLVASDSVGPAGQGISVGISADGNSAVVGGWSDDAAVGAAWVYACAAPEITGQPQGRAARPGESAALSVSATGAGTLAFQWYRGESGDTAAPVGADAPAFTTPPLTATESYWVRVRDACGTADSAAAVVTVGPGVRLHLRTTR